jgi:hypothetical protein
MLIELPIDKKKEKEEEIRIQAAKKQNNHPNSANHSYNAACVLSNSQEQALSSGIRFV